MFTRHEYQISRLHVIDLMTDRRTNECNECVSVGSGDGRHTATTTTTTSTTSLTDIATVSRLQDDAQLALNRYIDVTHHVAKPFRFGKLLLLLASLRSVSTDTIEDMYFRSALGDIPVSRIVADMFASANV